MTVRPTHAESIALNIGRAFLAGEWDPRSMGRRGERAVGDRRRWVTRLAEVARAGFPEKPIDRPRELGEFIAACEIFQTAIDDPDRPLEIKRRFPAPVAMGKRRWPVAEIDDMSELATWLGLSVDHLSWFADRRSMERSVTDERLRHYRRSWTRKGNGSIRLLEAPKKETKDLQRQVLHGILDRIPTHDAAHGFCRGRSIHTGAQRHAGSVAVIRMDLESFFTSVTIARVYGIFRSAGYAEPVAHALAALCSTVTPPAILAIAPSTPASMDPARRRMLTGLRQPHLPQGSPTSPALANLTAFALDRRLTALAGTLGATYTRYADDLVLSGDRQLLRRSGPIIKLVTRIAGEEGFRVNELKTRVMAASQRQSVTGLVINEGPNIPRPEYDRLRAILHDAVLNGPDHANRDGHPDFRSHLEGRIAWAAAGNPARRSRLASLAARIDW